jgi:predicted flap endonuclease-1-like 5' DNA nuclease
MLETIKENLRDLLGIDDTASAELEGSDPAIHARLISPTHIALSSKKVRTGEMWAQTIFVEGFPNETRVRMLDSIYSATGANVDVSIYINNHDTNKAINSLESAIDDIKASIVQKEEKGESSARRSQKRLNDHQTIYDSLTDGHDEMVSVGLYITIRAESKDRVGDAADDIIDTLRKHRLTVKKPAFKQQQDGLVTTSPLARDILRYRKRMSGAAAGALFPFRSKSVIEPEGVLWGFHAMNHSPLVVDRYARAGYNLLVAGDIGAGKSFDSKLNLLRRLSKDSDTVLIVIDPMGEFHRLTDAFNGKRIPINGSKSLNPMEIKATPDHIIEKIDDHDHNPFRQARIAAMDFFDMYFTMKSGDETGLDADRRGVLELAVEISYALKGITIDPATHSNESPTVTDVLDILSAMGVYPVPFVIAAETGIKFEQNELEQLGIRDIVNYVQSTSIADQIEASTTDTSDMSDARVSADGGNRSLESIDGIGSAYSDRLREADIATVNELASATPETVASITGAPQSATTDWIEQADGAVGVATADGGKLNLETPDFDGGTEEEKPEMPNIDTEKFGITEHDINDYRQHASSLRMAMQSFRPGRTYDHLAKETSVDIADSDEKVIYLDLEESETDQETSLMMKLMFRMIHQRAKQSSKQVIFAIDEAHMLIEDSESLEWLERATRHSRHHDLSIQLMTQSLEDMLGHKDAKVIADNTQMQVLHRIDKGISDDHQKYLEINDAEKQFVENATTGEAGLGFTTALLCVENVGNFPMRVEALEEEIPLIDGDAAENT